MGIFTLIGNIKNEILLGVVLAIALSAGGYVWKIKHDAAEAQKELVAAKAQRDAAAEATRMAVETNKTDQITIDQLNAEKKNVQQALNDLDAAHKKDQVVLGQISKSIHVPEVVANPVNQAKLSPVLADLVNQVQAARADREASGVTP